MASAEGFFVVLDSMLRISCVDHPTLRLCVGKVGKGWTKYGKSQAKSTYRPDIMGVGWGKGGRSVGKAMYCPPISQGSWGKGGERMVEGWEKPGKAHLSPRHHRGKLGKRWSKYGKCHVLPTYHPDFMGERWVKGGRSMGKAMHGPPIAQTSCGDASYMKAKQSQVTSAPFLKQPNKKCPPHTGGHFLSFLISSWKVRALHLASHNRLFDCHR